MCGIAGFLDFGSKSDADILKNMTDALQHRGPDDSGYLFKDVTSVQVGFGQRRLSILDLSQKGHQPMSFNGLTTIYNGEVYNFVEIRDELLKHGYKFDSDTDTEVILKAYHKWGVEMVDRLNGMFAIAILDEEKNNVTLIRDRAGVKPLYWYYKEDLFLFASELKSFHQHPSFENTLNLDAVALYFQHGYIPQPYSVYNNTYKLKAGHFLRIDLEDQNIDEHKYWDIEDYYKKPKHKIDRVEAISETEKLLKTACDYRMVADVPVGVFLSGGYDSSVVTAMLQKDRTDRIKTFTIGFNDPKYNEAEHAQAVAKHLNTNHTEYICSKDDVLGIFPTLADIWDEPFGDPSVIPTTLVSQVARRDVTVSLSADGGDELFGGYNKYTSIRKKISFYNKFPGFTKDVLGMGMQSKLIQKWANLLGLKNSDTRMDRWAMLIGMDEVEMMKNIANVFTREECIKLLVNENHKELETNFDIEPDYDQIDNILAIDYKTYQSDNILTKVDRATMSVSLEGREPLLDYKLAEFVTRLSSDLKINNGEKKWLLKEITHKYIPESIMRRPKMGFGAPIFEWLRTDLKSYLMHYLDPKRLRDAGIFNVHEVISIRDAFLNGNNGYSNKIWLLLLFEMWREKWG